MLALVLIALAVIVLAVAIGVTVRYRSRRRSFFVRLLAEELYTKTQMDALTRATARAMRAEVARWQGDQDRWSW
jgi:hypothetical protein